MMRSVWLPASSNCGEPLDAAGVDAYKELFSMDLDSDVDKKDDKDS